jgi:hypothetical protein
MLKIKSVKEASRLYDTLYELGQEVLDKYKPCIDCKTYCCDGCKYLSSKGCTVKSLACKLWLCSNIAYRNILASKEISKLRSISYSVDLMHLRASKKDTIKIIRRRSYTSSLVVSTT